MSCWGIWQCITRCATGGTDGDDTNSKQNLNEGEETSNVMLDMKHMGTECVVVKAGKRLCGTGCCLANAPIVQDKAYFEIKVQAGGIWGLGLATRATELETVPLGADATSWVLRNDGAVYHNGESVGNTHTDFEEGDIIGCSYDHVQLQFFHNGRNLDVPASGCRGKVYPVFYVDQGAILDVHFSAFTASPPSGHSAIMIEQNIL